MRPSRRRRWLYSLGLLLVVVPTATAVYLSQPLPGSQELDSVRFAWHLDRVRPFTEIGGGTLDGRRLRQVPASLEFRHSFEGFSGGAPWRPGEDGDRPSERN